MTQASRPNADHIANYPTSDAGPYSRDQWAEIFYIFFTGDQRTTQGPFERYLNELEVTNPAGVTIRVDTGAGICTGTVLVNSATVDFTPTTPLVGDRIDKVVMCLNNTNATYNTNLEFPTVLTDYNGTASIEPYSCRLVILTGEDGGAARALVQTASYFMIELARYTITMAPAISVGPTDYRVWCMTPTASVQKIQEYALTANTATITFDNIPQNFRHLKLVYQARSTYAIGTNDIVEMIFNNDGGANYNNLESGEWHANNFSTLEEVAGTFARIGDIATVGGAANTADVSVAHINNYRGAVFYKVAIATASNRRGTTTGNFRNYQTSSWWLNTAAITRIDLSCNLGSFVTGSVFTLYGLT